MLNSLKPADHYNKRVPYKTPTVIAEFNRHAFRQALNRH